MLELEAEPLLHADRQLVFVDGTLWIRSRCEKLFRPAPTGVETTAGPLLDFVPVEERCAALGIDYTREFVGERLEAVAVPDDQVMFHEAFENNDFEQNWDAWDANSSYGEDYWDVVSCNSHFGSSSAWCQGTNDKSYPACTVVDRYVDSWMAPKQGTTLYGYTDKELSYWIDHDMWHDWNQYSDFVWVYLLWDGQPILVDEHQEIWSGWHQSTIDLTNIPVGVLVGKEYVLIPYKPAFRFYNDATLHSWELAGAYIDDVLISGCPQLGTVSLLDPANAGDICTGTGVWYCWEPADGASSYRVQWAVDGSFAEGTIIGDEVAIGTCYHRPYAGSGPIYWRVRPENSCRVGSWSSVRWINLIDVPQAVSVAKPPDGYHMCSGSAYRFTWLEVPTAIGYTISWFSYFPQFPETAWTQEPHKYLTLFGEFANWRVRATNQCGDGAWSPLRTVHLDGGPLPTSWDLTSETFSDAQIFEATNWITAGPDVSIVAPGVVTLESPRVELRNGFSVSTGGSLTIKSSQPSCG